jgi:thiamine kinase-like enzyme
MGAAYITNRIGDDAAIFPRAGNKPDWGFIRRALNKLNMDIAETAKVYTSEKEVILVDMANKDMNYRLPENLRDWEGLDKGKVVVKLFPTLGEQGYLSMTCESNGNNVLKKVIGNVPDIFYSDMYAHRPVIVEEYIAGSSIEELLLSDRFTELEDALTKTAKSLKKLHSADIKIGCDLPVTNKHKTRCKEKAVDFFKNEGETDLAEKVKELYDSIPDNLTSIIHGDSHIANIIYNENKDITFIDCDSVSISDPLVDIARLFSTIELIGIKKGLDKEEIMGLEDRFLQAYQPESLPDESMRIIELYKIRELYNALQTNNGLELDEAQKGTIKQRIYEICESQLNKSAKKSDNDVSVSIPAEVAGSQ